MTVTIETTYTVKCTKQQTEIVITLVIFLLNLFHRVGLKPQMKCVWRIYITTLWSVWRPARVFLPMNKVWQLLIWKSGKCTYVHTLYWPVTCIFGEGGHRGRSGWVRIFVADLQNKFLEPPPGPILIFKQFSGNFVRIIGWRLLWEILDPPLDAIQTSVADPDGGRVIRSKS